MRKIIFIFVIALLVAQVSATLDFERENRLNFGHVVNINSLGIEDNNVLGGNSKTLNFVIENTANFSILDIRVQVNLPSEISFQEGISKRKIAKLDSGESQLLSYNLTYLSGISDGVYEAQIMVDYVNHIGDERQDNDTFSIIIKKEPRFFTVVDSTELYERNKLGDVTLKFVNNDVADIKFLTVELLDTQDYKVISNNKEYIGDLDSDDFESVDFRLKLTSKDKEVPLILNLYYKDSLNQDYSNELQAMLKIRTAKELGVSKSNNTSMVIGVVVVLIIGYFIYRKFRKKKKFKMW